MYKEVLEVLKEKGIALPADTLELLNSSKHFTVYDADHAS